jgi:BlaI family penicillinase repressor
MKDSERRFIPKVVQRVGKPAASLLFLMIGAEEGTRILVPIPARQEGPKTIHRSFLTSITGAFTLWGTDFHLMGSNFHLMRKPTKEDATEKISLARLPISCATVSNTMDGNTRSGHDPAELGELERSILSIVWRMGTVTAEQVREGLDRPLKDSTVRTVLRRLEEKGYLAHTVEDRTFLYRPAQSRQRVAGRAAKRIVDWFCEGSVEALLVGLVDSKVLDRAELQRLAARIAEAQKSTAARKGEEKP